jgi:hypothetical protein
MDLSTWRQVESSASNPIGRNIDITTCGSGHTLDNPCTNTAMANSSTPAMTLQAHPNDSLYGMVYQPRGSWLTMQGNGNITSPTIFVRAP